ncbi:two-component sensor histidine kinase [Bacillus sp. 7586-K]|uniref:sensor histidine kinase n=1 Tax=Metabacillus niabensis TaxID=324854 RepID=UPI000BA6AF08|nr:two-component sensor histidine kinase [Bacillus sp. 7586-K]
MRIKTRFILHFALGLTLWLLGTGLCIPIILQGILPLFDVMVNSNTEGLIVGWIFTISSLVCIILFGWYFGGPIASIMGWIHQISQGHYDQPSALQKIYTRKGKFRMRYLLYKEVLHSLKSLAKQLQANEVERKKIEKAKHEWIAGISHDLKTPLTYITGYSTLLLTDQYEWSTGEARTFIQEMYNKGKHMEELIQDLNLVLKLNYADRPLPINKTNQDLVEFTKRVVADICNNPQASEYSLHFKSDVATIHVEFDVKFMQRILQNILMNSILHNPEPIDIYIQLYDYDENVRILITDHGVGMPTHMLENLFQQYYRGTTTDSASEGTGLGMAIVYNLVHAHDGTITVESEPSKGTAFDISLPKTGRSQDNIS